MPATVVFRTDHVRIADYRCVVGPADGPPETEVHGAFSLAYVRKGTFGYHCEGQRFDLVAGSVMVGSPGREYIATHDHGYGDECLSFTFSPDVLDDLPGAKSAWRVGAVAPLPPLLMLAELARRIREGASDVGGDELALLLAQRFVQLAVGSRPSFGRASAVDRRRSIRAALWIEEHASETIGLSEAAREAELSPCHFLRVFSSVLGLTPHQHLVRIRLRRAAQLLVEDDAKAITDIAYEVGFGDLSNFVRTFRAAAGVSPRQFRHAARGDQATISSTPEMR